MTMFTEEDADKAILLVSPLIVKLLEEEGWIKRDQFHLIISRREPDGQYVILAEKSFGHSQECEEESGIRFKPIAEGKTAITAATGLSSREVQLMRPDLLEAGDVIYWGSVIQGDIIVAGSGVQPWIDEAISKSCLAICMALLQERVETLKKDAADEVLSDYYDKH